MINLLTHVCVYICVYVEYGTTVISPRAMIIKMLKVIKDWFTHCNNVLYNNNVIIDIFTDYL